MSHTPGQKLKSALNQKSILNQNSTLKLISTLKLKGILNEKSTLNPPPPRTSSIYHNIKVYSCYNPG